MLWFQRTLDIRNHSQRHKDYRNYWKSLKDLGFWENPDYLRSTTAAGISEDELRGYASLCLERCEETVSKPWWDTIYIWGISAFNFFNKLFCSFVFLIKLVPNIISKCFVFLLQNTCCGSFVWPLRWQIKLLTGAFSQHIAILISKKKETT